ncbi:MAG TPA: DUF4905 domain-containing protein [Bacteroidota bacterium]
MNIISLFGRKSLKSAWTFAPSGTIWRLLASESGELIGECRDEEKKLVSFFALQGESGKVLWQNLVLDEKWWTGIEEISGGVILLHGFSSPDLPGHQGIIAVDLMTGERLWTSPDFTYWFVHENSVIAHRSLFEKRLFYELNLRSGAMVREFDPDSESMLLQLRGESLLRNKSSLEFPEAVDIHSIDLRTAKGLKKQLPLSDIQGTLEGLLVGTYGIFDYHLHSAQSVTDTFMFDNHLKIIDLKTGTVIYFDVLSQGTKAPVPDSFFVKANVVFYIKDRKTLTAVRLPA